VLAGAEEAEVGTVEVFNHASAFSPIIALAMDYVCAVCGPPEKDYRMVTATGTDDPAYATAPPVAGVMDPGTKAPRPRGRVRLLRP
jgi:hypothetical protein